MGQSIIAGLAYFGCVFAAGFVLGVLRALFVVPRLGETFAVAMELPIIIVHLTATLRPRPNAILGSRQRS